MKKILLLSLVLIFGNANELIASQEAAPAQEFTFAWLKGYTKNLQEVLIDAQNKLQIVKTEQQKEVMRNYINERLQNARFILSTLTRVPEAKADNIKEAQLSVNLAEYYFQQNDYDTALAALLSFTRGLLNVNEAALTLEQEKELEEAEMRAIKRKRTEKLPGRARRSGTNKLLVPESKASESGDEYDEGPFEA